MAYDQGQFTTCLYDLIDADGVPLILRGVDPKNYVIEKDQTWNPHTILQIDESQYTHVPEEKLHQQNAMLLPIAVERLFYEPFMIEQPMYIAPLTQMDSLMLNGVLNPMAMGTGAGASLLLWSKDRDDRTCIRDENVYPGQKAGALPVPANSFGVRIYDAMWALDTMFNYNKNMFQKPHEDQRQLGPNASWVRHTAPTVDSGRRIFTALVGNAQRISDVERIFLNALMNNATEVDLDSEVATEGGKSRQTLFDEYGKYMDQHKQQLAQFSRTAKLLIWLFLPHAFNQAEVNELYERYMFGIAYSLIYNRWPQNSDFKGGQVVTYPGMAQPSNTNKAMEGFGHTAIDVGFGVGAAGAGFINPAAGAVVIALEPLAHFFLTYYYATPAERVQLKDYAFSMSRQYGFDAEAWTNSWVDWFNGQSMWTHLPDALKEAVEVVAAKAYDANGNLLKHNADPYRRNGPIKDSFTNYVLGELDKGFEVADIPLPATI